MIPVLYYSTLSPLLFTLIEENFDLFCCIMLIKSHTWSQTMDLLIYNFLISVLVNALIIYIYIYGSRWSKLILIVIKSPGLGFGCVYSYLESFMCPFICDPYCRWRMVIVGPYFVSYWAGGGIYTWYIMTLRLDIILLIYVAFIYLYALLITNIVFWYLYLSTLWGLYINKLWLLFVEGYLSLLGLSRINQVIFCSN